MKTNLPVEGVLPDVVRAIKTEGCAVLEAPPGAGKTTRVPLALLEQSAFSGRLVMLEPRRLAAFNAATYMARTLGEPVGKTAGYRMRGDSKTSNSTRIEVVTEGILTRMIQSDPSLDGIGALVFDEFHERSLNADLGLALAWEVKQALREDLSILVMSATLDANPIAKMLGNAPIIRSEGRSYAVETRWLEKPTPKDQRFERTAVQLIERAVSQTTGSILAFLPGEGEIRRIAASLNVPADTVIRPLFGAMPYKDQQAAIKPDAKHRKIVLATSIAETSLTIEDIRVVVDTGRARRARFDQGSGMSRLVTERVSRAEAAQRAGRAGRVADGTAYVMWTKGEQGALAPFPPVGMQASDLSGLALELAQWGTAPGDLAFLTQPPEASLSEAQSLLRELGALNADGKITTHGQALVKVPIHPRLGHMLLKTGKLAAPMAALLADRDILQGAPCDLTLRLEAMQDRQKFARERPYKIRTGALDRIQQDARRLEKFAPSGPSVPAAIMAAFAYPDRIAKRRPGDAPKYLLANGKGAVLPSDDALASATYIVATDLDGDRKEARIRQCIALSEQDLRTTFKHRIATVQMCSWSKRDRRVTAREQEKLGALSLSDRPWKAANPDDIARAALDGVRDLGLSLSPAAARFRARVMIARQSDSNLPDMSDDTLLATLETWLLPFVGAAQTAAEIARIDTLAALRATLSFAQSQSLDKVAPSDFTTPLSRKIPIDYNSSPPEISLRLQEMFGVAVHPAAGGHPLRVTLLSPANRPIQTTTDIPGFWSGSYSDVRKDMRARYPKHAWPENPLEVQPTLKTKRKS